MHRSHRVIFRGVDGLSWCVWSGPSTPAPAVLGSDGIGRLGTWTWHGFSDGNSRFIHSTAAAPKKRSAKDSDVGKSKVTSWTTRTNERRDCKRQFAPNQQPAAVNCPTGRMRVGLAGFEIRPRSRSRRFRFQMQLTRLLIESFLVQGGDGDGDSEERACETSPVESPCRAAEARTRGGRAGCRRGQREKEEGGRFVRFVRFVRCGFPARGMRRGRGRESSPGNWQKEGNGWQGTITTWDTCIPNR